MPWESGLIYELTRENRAEETGKGEHQVYRVFFKNQIGVLYDNTQW
jgi:hypothetical protein